MWYQLFTIVYFAACNIHAAITGAKMYPGSVTCETNVVLLKISRKGFVFFYSETY